MRESKIEAYLVRGVQRLGGWCIKFPPIFFRGFPDRIVLMPKGRIYFVETKATGQTPRLIQRKVHESLRRLGFVVEVLDSKEAIEAFLINL